MSTTHSFTFRLYDRNVVSCVLQIDEIMQMKLVQDDRLIRLFPAKTDVVLMLSFMSACVLLVSWVPGAGLMQELEGQRSISWSNTTALDVGDMLEVGGGNLTGSVIDLQIDQVNIHVTGRATDPATYSRWRNVILTEDVPEMWLAHMVISGSHLIMCILGFNYFLKVKVPVLLKRHHRQQRRAHNANAALDINSMDKFKRMTVHVYALDHELANPKALKKAFARFGNIVGMRVNNFSEAANNWALVSFSSQASVESIRETMASSVTSDQVETGFLTTKRHGQAVTIKVGMLTDQYVELFGSQLAHQVEDLQYETTSAEDRSIGYQAVQHAQEAVNMTLGAVGLSWLARKIPLQPMYLLRRNITFWGAFVDIALSIGGVTSSPLLLSWHLLRVTRWNLATVVVKSITANFGRIMTTVALGLLAMYAFAIMGVIFFKDDHDVVATSVKYTPE